MNILFLDIEASDLAADIGHILSIGYKWNFEKKAHVLDILRYPGKTLNDDSKLLEVFRAVYNKADMVIHHFGTYYDVPFLQTRLLINKQKPYPNIQQVDTWAIAKKKMRFGSNRLERILEVLGCPFSKSPVKLSIWADARLGDKKAIAYVVKHNLADVLVLEWVYNKIKALYSSHPRVIPDKKLCGICGKGKLVSNGIRPTLKKVYRRLSCDKCGATEKGEIV